MPHRRWILAIAILSWSAVPCTRAAEAQLDSLASTVSTASGPRASAPLVIGNRPVFEFRTTYLGYSPEERAKAAHQRIRQFIQSHPRTETTVTVTTTDTPLGTLMVVDGKWILNVTPGDVDALTGESYAQLVERTRTSLGVSLNAMLEQRTLSRLTRSIVVTLVATIVFWLLIRNLGRLIRWIGRRVEAKTRAHADKLSLQPSKTFAQAMRLLHVVLRTVGAVIALGLTYTWVTFVLKQFPYTAPWGDHLDDYLFSIGSTAGWAIVHAVPSLLMLLLIGVLARFAAHWVRIFFEAVGAGRIEFMGLDAETAVATQRLVTLFVWLLAVATAYPYIPGSGGTAFKGLSLLFGLMLSLGSSNVISQAASGYMLIFSKALRLNDYVRFGEYEGTVMSLGVLSTKIRTARDEEINVPNAVIVSSITKNYTRLNRDKGAPLATSVTIGYSAPWRQVHAMLRAAADKTSGLRKVPEPRVIQTSLSDFYVEYVLVVRLEHEETRWQSLSALNANIQDMFNEYGVQIMSPHYEGDPAAKVWVPKEQWHASPADPPA